MTDLFGSSFAGFNKNTVREKNDFYPTPEPTTRAILDRLDMFGQILEPACGDGAISKLLKEYYPTATIHSSDLYDRGYGKVGIDFLEMPEKLQNKPTYDYVITNPPFKIAQEFVEAALKITKKQVIMFAKIQLLEGAKRKEFLEKSPLKYVYVFSKRQSLYANGIKGNKGTSTMCFAWYVWEIGYSGEPMIRWI